jgi:UDP-N-acetylglucosamine acyltransferase
VSAINEEQPMCIHESAIVEPGAMLGEGVEVGPYTTVGADVVIGAGTKIGARVSIRGNTTLGTCNRIFDGAIIGCRSQDRKFDGRGGPVVIGDDNTIREYVTITAGSSCHETTAIGNENLLMAYCHVGHGCQLGNDLTLANGVTLAGHVHIDDGATIGGLAAVHQFTRIGRLSMIGGCSKIVQDVPPYMLCDGHPARTVTVNVVGLKRAMIAKADIDLMRVIHRLVFRSGKPRRKAIAEAYERFASHTMAGDFLAFIDSSDRGVC